MNRMLSNQRRVPTRLKVDCAKREARGEYCLVVGEGWMGLPVWERDTDQRECVYSDAEGRWIIGTVEVMRDNAGWIMSGEHGGAFPHELGGWCQYSTEGWVPASVKVGAEGTSPWPATSLPLPCSGASCASPGEFLCVECEKLLCGPCKYGHDCRAVGAAAAPRIPSISRSVPIAHNPSPSPLPQVATSPAMPPLLQEVVQRGGGAASLRSLSSAEESRACVSDTGMQLHVLEAELQEQRRRGGDLQRDLDAARGEAAVLHSQLKSSDAVLCAVRDERDALSAKVREAEAAAAAAASAPRAAAGVPAPPRNPFALAEFAAPQEGSPSGYAVGADGLSVSKSGAGHACSALVTSCLGVPSSGVGAPPRRGGARGVIHFHYAAMRGAGRRGCVGVAAASGAPRVDLRADGLIFVNGDVFEPAGRGGRPAPCFGEGDAVTLELDPAAGRVSFTVLDSTVTVPLPRAPDAETDYHPCVRLVGDGDEVRIVHGAREVSEAAALRRLVEDKQAEVDRLAEAVAVLEAAASEARSAPPPPLPPLQLFELEWHDARGVEHAAPDEAPPPCIEAAGHSPAPVAAEPVLLYEVAQQLASPRQACCVGVGAERPPLHALQWHSMVAAVQGAGAPEAEAVAAPPPPPPLFHRAAALAVPAGGRVATRDFAGGPLGPARRSRGTNTSLSVKAHASPRTLAACVFDPATPAYSPADSCPTPAPVSPPPPPLPQQQHSSDAAQGAVAVLACIYEEDWEAAHEAFADAFGLDPSGGGAAPHHGRVSELAALGRMLLGRLEEKVVGAPPPPPPPPPALQQHGVSSARHAALPAQAAAEQQQHAHPDASPAPAAALLAGHSASTALPHQGGEGLQGCQGCGGGHGVLQGVEEVLRAVARGASLPPCVFDAAHVMYPLLPLVSRLHTNAALLRVEEAKASRPRPLLVGRALYVLFGRLRLLRAAFSLLRRAAEGRRAAPLRSTSTGSTQHRGGSRDRVALVAELDRVERAVSVPPAAARPAVPPPPALPDWLMHDPPAAMRGGPAGLPPPRSPEFDRSMDSGVGVAGVPFDTPLDVAVRRVMHDSFEKGDVTGSSVRMVSPQRGVHSAQRSLAYDGGDAVAALEDMLHNRRSRSGRPPPGRSLPTRTLS